MSEMERTPSQEEAEDSLVSGCLALIERDIATKPERVRPLSVESMERARQLVGDLNVDPNEVLDDDATLKVPG